MSIAVECGNCFREYQVKESFAGREVPCKECGELMFVAAAGRPRTVGKSSRGRRPVAKKPFRVDTRMWIGAGIAAFVLTAVLVGVVVVQAVSRQAAVRRAPLASEPLAAEPFGSEPAGGEASSELGTLPSATIASFPPLPPPRAIDTGILMSQVALRGDRSQPGTSMQLWVYLPAGQHADHSLPCVLIAPAGSNMLIGMGLAQGDQPEHIPYVRAGFAVVAYTLDGAIRNRETASDAEFATAYKKFQQADAGLVNARNALEYALAQIPQVDPERVFTAGHSSAGATALLFAEHEPRIRGCVAFAPCSDVEAYLADITGSAITQMLLPGVAKFAKQSSPATHAGKLNCPVFLFHAADDQNVSIRETQKFAGLLRSLGKDVTLETVPRGDHYDSMVDQGIPAAIRWLQAH